MVVWGLGMFGVTEETLPRLPKRDTRRITLASLVKGRNLVRNHWLADRFSMGVASRVSAYCGQAENRSDVVACRQLLEEEIGKMQK